MAVSAAAEIRAAICRKGGAPPVSGWDRVALLRLDDPTLAGLHALLTAAHHRGMDLGAVVPPPGVSIHQVE